MNGHHDAPDSARFSIGDWLFVFGLIAFAILVPALIVKVHLFGKSSSFSLSTRTVGGLVAGLLAFAAVVFNLHLGFVRAWLHKRRFGTMDGFQYASGMPFLGSIFVFYAAMTLPTNTSAGVSLLLLYFLDPLGIHVAAFVFVRGLFASDAK